MKKIVPVVIVAAAVLLAGSVYFMQNNGPVEADAGRHELDVVEGQIQVNENGQTYGSAAMVASEEELPDLILVIGTEGQLGYVYREEWIYKPSSPEEAVELTLNPEPKLVPLYDSNGIDVIGSYDQWGANKESTSSEGIGDMPDWLE